MGQRKMFCEWGPVCYRLAMAKENVRKSVMDFFAGTHFASDLRSQPIQYIIKSHLSPLRRRLAGVDMALQDSKVQNLRLAAEKINGIVIAPGETFSFWRLVGSCTTKKGYQPGLVIRKNGAGQDIGGGLCQLANLIHYMVLHSPLTVVELHHHSDALFPDSERRVPFGTGTSVFYKKIDYRFANRTDADFQVRVWLDDTYLYGELRSSVPYPLRCRLVEEDHCFTQEKGVWYRNSRIYRCLENKDTGEQLSKELLLVNHSKVLYDPALIPPEQIRPNAICNEQKPLCRDDNRPCPDTAADRTGPSDEDDIVPAGKGEYKK